MMKKMSIVKSYLKRVNDGGNLTVIPVVADPIDIINPYTPPAISGNFDWALVAILAGLALVSLVGIGLGAAKEK